MVSQEKFGFVTKAASMGKSDLELRSETHNVGCLLANLLVHPVSSRLDVGLPNRGNHFEKEEQCSHSLRMCSLHLDW